jgi:hypothetical protein
VFIDYTPSPCGAWDQGITITIGEAVQTRDDLGCGTDAPSDWSDLRFPWPAGIVAGETGTIELASGGDGVRACGAASFTADPAACVTVEVHASCERLDGGPSACAP